MTLDERLSHIAEAKRRLDTRIPWLADSMSNDLKHAFGDRNNSEFIIDPEGTVILARNWSDPDQLRKDLAGLVGESPSLTRVEDLDRKPEAPIAHPKARRGVLPRVARPSDPVALITRPVSAAPSKDGEQEEPLYAKIRVEVSKPLLEGGEGQLYLGVHLDPVHHVHWNNLAAPLRYEITPPPGVTVSPSSGSAPEIEAADFDLDPREFLLEVDLGDSAPSAPLAVRIDYFACDDDDQFCKAISQEFAISWMADRDAGRVQNRGGAVSSNGNRSRPSGQMPRRPFPDPAQLMNRLDRNQDEKISREESEGPLRQRFDQMDQNGDSAITLEEIKRFFEKRKQER